MTSPATAASRTSRCPRSSPRRSSRLLDDDRVRRHEDQHVALIERTIVDYAHLGGHAGYIGAAGIARVNYHKTNK